MHISVALYKAQIDRLNYYCHITLSCSGLKATVTSQLLEKPQITQHVDELGNCHTQENKKDIIHAVWAARPSSVLSLHQQ